MVRKFSDAVKFHNLLINGKLSIFTVIINTACKPFSHEQMANSNVTTNVTQLVSFIVKDKTQVYNLHNLNWRFSIDVS